MEIPEMRQDEGGEGEQIARTEGTKEGENGKREVVSKEIEESRDKAGGDPHNNSEGATRGEPQQGHKDGEDKIFEREMLEFGEDGIDKLKEPEYERTAVSANQATPDTSPDKLRQFDWVTDIDESIGLVPTSNDFCPTKPPSPSVSPNPTTRPHANLVMPVQPVCTPPKPTITQQNGDVALRAPTPTTGAPALVNPYPSNIAVLKEPAPTVPSRPSRQWYTAHTTYPHFTQERAIHGGASAAAIMGVIQIHCANSPVADSTNKDIL
jgi:hypothetical protein